MLCLSVRWKYATAATLSLSFSSFCQGAEDPSCRWITDTVHPLHSLARDSYLKLGRHAKAFFWCHCYIDAAQHLQCPLCILETNGCVRNVLPILLEFTCGRAVVSQCNLVQCWLSNLPQSDALWNWQVGEHGAPCRTMRCSLIVKVKGGGAVTPWSDRKSELQGPSIPRSSCKIPYGPFLLILLKVT